MPAGYDLLKIELIYLGPEAWRRVLVVEPPYIFIVVELRACIV